MREVYIETASIRLDQLLKLANIAASRGEAKALIRKGFISVNFQTTTKRSKKIFSGDIVTVNNTTEKIKVCSQS